MERQNSNFKPKVSIIIPTYNRADIIGRAINSILEQTYRDFEIIVVDDSPDDSTQKIVNSLNDERIKYIQNKGKTNLPRARNQGIMASSESSEYIAFLDDDDEWLPLFLEKTINILEENKGLVMVISHAVLKEKNGRVIGEARCDRKVEFWEQSIGSGCVVRRNVFFEENFWYDERKVMEDLDFGIRVLEKHNWKCLPEVLRVYYPYPLPHETSASSSLPLGEIELFYSKHLSTYSKAGKRALAYFYFKVGREFLKAGETKKGTLNLSKAFLSYPCFKYFLYWVISMFSPSLFKNIRVRTLKQKIFKGKM